MEKRFRTPLFSRLTGWIVLLIFLLSFISPVGPVQADDQAGFVITSLSPAETEICIGQKVSIFGEYAYNVDPASPLIPLAGPDRIITHAGVGTTGPQNLYPGVPSGSFEFEYQGVEAGTDQVTASIIYAGKTVEGKPVAITVTKKCVYSYRLVAHIISDASKGNVIDKFENTITIGGKLVTDYSTSMTLLTGTTRVEVVTDYLEFKMPDCALFTWSPGYAEGSADVRADLSSSSLVKFQIGLPKNLDWVYKAAGECDGQAAGVSDNIDLTQFLHDDPWVEQDFLPEGGTKQIKMYFLDQAMRNCAKGGMQCDYNATLTLTREKGE